MELANLIEEKVKKHEYVQKDGRVQKQSYFTIMEVSNNSLETKQNTNLKKKTIIHELIHTYPKIK